jgi:hypothetical protein
MWNLPTSEFLSFVGSSEWTIIEQKPGLACPWLDEEDRYLWTLTT